jgi:hypothetical protein
MNPTTELHNRLSIAQADFNAGATSYTDLQKATIAIWSEAARTGQFDALYAATRGR